MYSEYEREILADIDREILAQHPVLSELELKRFVSYSAGRGRKRSRPVEVALLVRRRGGGAESWHKVTHDRIHELIDGETNLNEDEIIRILLNGSSEPDR